MSKSSYKTRYVIFILTVTVTIMANEAMLRHNLNLEDSDAKILNVAGRQRMLSQRIVKNLLFMIDESSGADGRYTGDSLAMLVKEFEDANHFLTSVERQNNNGTRIRSLLESVQPAITKSRPTQERLSDHRTA